jgi:hypothetical protein
MGVIFRVYAVSVMARQHRSPISGETIYKHYAAIKLCKNMESVKKEAEELSFKMFPQAGGWSSHSAVIVPIKRELADAIHATIQTGAFLAEPDPEESTQVFNF